MSAPPVSTVFDVQRFSIHDGPGIRTAIFFKGCSLHCDWCQNPESLRRSPELAFYADRCIESDHCFAVCPENALLRGTSERVDWSRCTDCGRCVDPCPSEALTMIGRNYTARELLDECVRDREYFLSSGGGVTLTGGEAVLQHRFLAAFLPQLKTVVPHVLLETAGAYPFATLEPLLEWIDSIYFDLKLGTSESHQLHTGVPLDGILANLRALVTLGKELTVRVPLVPGYNTTDSEIDGLTRHLNNLGIAQIHLLRYNHFWEAKLERLRGQRPALGLQHQEAAVDGIVERLARQGIEAIPVWRSHEDSR